ncbi:DUF3108 domain-containing protein [Janthinobacterium fluminis]|uniref:DUF3108 domain-containing protein n=1 Tax=Janthinobacterium fluminis TaxID=2987524 RepID=A0ABT5K7E9_9BURK|nr:DUF3108 domain-containing protein [Janthinobacterium fluminis]MDC8760716.1 DUF3108 domain-containing protein [Janthinobacterium fluminis]
MLKTTLQRTLAAALLAATLAPALAAAKHPSVKRAFNVPPSADLSYSIKARQRGMSLGGENLTVWRAGDGSYSLVSETRAALFGKILENKSEGAIDDYGLAPALYTEKRFRKEASTATFKRDSKTIVFGDSDESYPLKGGEQDRNSAPWQLAAVARGAPEQFTPGSEWTFFVAGRRDAEPWIFKVVKQESVRTGEGEVNAVHLVKAPPPDAKGQQVDLWLAPSLEWYPVRLRFADSDGDYVEQTLEKITKK